MSERERERERFRRSTQAHDKMNRIKLDYTKIATGNLKKKDSAATCVL